jgi:hypothetical protein
MKIELINSCPDAMQVVIAMVNIYYPRMKTDNINNTNSSRLIRKLIRQQDIILQMPHILTRIYCPLYVYHELYNFKDVDFGRVSYKLEPGMFDMPSGLSDEKKAGVIDIMDNIQKHIKGMSQSELSKIVPSCINVSFDLYLDFLTIFDILIDEHKVSNATSQLIHQFYQLLNNTNPQFFTIENLEIYKLQKESKC